MPKPQLFLLHFAGGNCFSFQAMTAALNDFEVISLELPGRGRRMDEALLTDFDLAARDFYDQISRRLTAPVFLIYGHSMGAYLALRVTHMLESSGKTPEYLIVSGNPGPGVRDNKKRYLLTGDAFVSELKKLGGVPEEFLMNKELFDFFEPILRADFEVSEKNALDMEPAVMAPIFAVMGSQEDNVEKISNWSRFTRSHFQYEIMEGDHFFIFQHADKIARVVRESYKRVVYRRAW